VPDTTPTDPPVEGPEPHADSARPDGARPGPAEIPTYPADPTQLDVVDRDDEVEPEDPDDGEEHL
jgi:hypothetical protein